jgi:hypothetical protein
MLRRKGPGGPSSSVFVLPLRLFKSSRYSRKLVENGGTEGALRGHGPPLKNSTAVRGPVRADRMVI